MPAASPKSRQITLRWPLRGVVRQFGFQSQEPYSTPDALNVLPQDVLANRSRGGSRPGLSKYVTTDRDSFYQFLGTIRVDQGSGAVEYRDLLIAAESGHLLWAHPEDAMWPNWNEVAGGPYLNPAVRLEFATHEQKVYIADYVNASGTDGEIDAYTHAFKSDDVGDWSTQGITAENATQYSLQVVAGGSGTVAKYAISGYEVTYENEGSIAIVSGVVTKTGGAAFPAWAAAGSLTVGLNTYTIDTRDGDDQLTLDNTGVNEGSTGTYAITLDSEYLLLATSPGTVPTTGIHFRLHRVPKVWDVNAGTVANWTASTGALPLDCTLICNYFNRIVLAGDLYNPQAWYAARVDNPTDFGYAEEDLSSAVAYSNYLRGQIGKAVTALIPHGYDCLLLGAKDGMYVMKGNPASTSSQLNQISDVVGTIDARSHCKLPTDETILLTRDGVYYINAGCGHPPIPLSDTIPDELQDIVAGSMVDNSASTFHVSMTYDLLTDCVQIWVLPTNNAHTSCFFLHWPHKAFWPVKLAQPMQPVSVCDYSLAAAGGQRSSIILGGYDGITRHFDREAEDDDGTNFTSYCRIGPFMLAPNSDNKGIVQRMRIVTGDGSGAATWKLIAASTAEACNKALAGSTHFQSGTVNGYAAYPREAGSAGMLQIGANGAAVQWVFEEAVVQYREAGKMR